MGSYQFMAGCLLVALGLAHSVLGEILIFSRMRQGVIVPTNGHPVLRERHVRILWASWHLVTVFGWALGAILLWTSMGGPGSTGPKFIEATTLLATLSGAILVLVGTKGRHPGWVVLLAVATCLAVGGAGS